MIQTLILYSLFAHGTGRDASALFWSMKREIYAHALKSRKSH